CSAVRPPISPSRPCRTATSRSSAGSTCRCWSSSPACAPTCPSSRRSRRRPKPGASTLPSPARRLAPEGLVFIIRDMNSAANPGRALAQQLTIVNRKGLHARASARFVRTAECFDAEIHVVRDGTTVAGNSIMGLMMLGAGPGATILVQATGRQAREALDAITALVNSGFDEDSEGAAAL